MPDPTDPELASLRRDYPAWLITASRGGYAAWPLGRAVTAPTIPALRAALVREANRRTRDDL